MKNNYFKENLRKLIHELNILNKSLIKKEESYKTTDYFLDIEKNKSEITNNNKKLKLQLDKKKEKLKEFNTLSFTASAEKDKLIESNRTAKWKNL